MSAGDKTRKLIIEKANLLFYHRGFNNTAFSDIVESTGLSKGNITYHFKTKEKILEHIIQQRLTDFATLLAQWDDQYPQPLDRLIRFCEMLIIEQDNLSDYGCPMGTLTSEFAKHNPEHYEITFPLFQETRQWLTRQFYLLGYAKSKANNEAMAFLARLQGISMVTHAFKDKQFLRREVKSLIKDLKN